MIYTKMTEKALKTCFEAHKNQYDKSGMPYVFHPFHLAEQMTDEISTTCALLHDVVEDTDITLEDLAEMGFPKDVLEVLDLLTHKEGVEYMDYIKIISQNKIAVKVKIADLIHNSDTTRTEKIDEWVIKRNLKYKKALDYLNSLE